MAEGTVCGRFNAQVGRSGDGTAFRYREGGAWRDITWREYGTRVREAALGLVDLGISRRDCVALLSGNRPEWHIADVATMCTGARTVPVYLTASPPQIAYVAGHSESKVIFVGNEDMLRKVEKERGELPALTTVVILDGESSADGFVLSLEDLRARGRALDAADPARYESLWQSVEPDDLATIVYTSGTTGNPKGVMLSHANLTWTMDHVAKVLPTKSNHRLLSYLPLSHIAERMMSHMMHIHFGFETWFAESLETLARDLVECRPTTFFGVPRVFEKVHAGIKAKVASEQGLKKAIADRAFSVAERMARLRAAGKPAPVSLSIRHALFERLVYSKLRATLGLDQARRVISGAAPINPSVLMFYLGVGFPITEVYGQTEDCGPTAYSPPEESKIGTVGRAHPGVEIKIADDGEILVRGGNVFQGYYKDEEATAETLADGWLHSGDVGFLDEEGYLHVTDRKKDLIITASGKNVSPQEIENRLKYHPLISQAVVVGDARPYLTALITLDPEGAGRFAQERGIGSLEPTELATHPAIEETIASAIEAVNTQFSRIEGIKRWKILPREFDLDSEEVTPTLKVRRRIITEKYADVIDDLYAA